MKLAALPLLTACATPSPPSDPVGVPIPTPCRVTMPTAPAQCVARDDSRQEWLRCELVDCLAWRQYAVELAAALKGCAE